MRARDLVVPARHKASSLVALFCSRHAVRLGCGYSLSGWNNRVYSLPFVTISPRCGVFRWNSFVMDNPNSVCHQFISGGTNLVAGAGRDSGTVHRRSLLIY